MGSDDIVENGVHKLDNKKLDEAMDLFKMANDKNEL